MFLNTTETIGVLIGTATVTTTGSIFLTLLIPLIILSAIAMLFGIRLEFTAIILMPLLLGYMAYYSEFVGVGGVIMIYLAMIFAQKFFIK